MKVKLTFLIIKREDVINVCVCTRIVILLQKYQRISRIKHSGRMIKIKEILLKYILIMALFLALFPSTFSVLLVDSQLLDSCLEPLLLFYISTQMTVT